MIHGVVRLRDPGSLRIRGCGRASGLLVSSSCCRLRHARRSRHHQKRQLGGLPWTARLRLPRCSSLAALLARMSSTEFDVGVCHRVGRLYPSSITTSLTIGVRAAVMARHADDSQAIGHLAATAAGRRRPVCMCRGRCDPRYSERRKRRLRMKNCISRIRDYVATRKHTRSYE